MLNYAETASSSTNIPSLSALLAHPEFQEGLAVGHEFFFDSYDEALLTQDEMIEEVKGNLSRRIIARNKEIARLTGDEPPSYLYNLGYVVGVIDQGLTYTR